ncbi:MAG: type I methionyl aminopeptidase [Bacteroidales bacterium]|nr:type I methionyl aminopeptidase [Bacteroidales bacterium]
MIFIKTAEEIELLRASNLLVSRALSEVGKAIKPGVSTLKLDKIAEEYLRDHGGIPGFLGYNGFPATLCTSLNDEVVHGIPSEKELRKGDILSVDCGVKLQGYFGDSAYTFPVGEPGEEYKSLMFNTRESLFKGIEAAVAGNRLGDIGYAIQNHAEQAGYSVVREMVGHGLGQNLHEEPEVPNYGSRGSGIKLKEGMVICIEPMINMGTRFIKQDKDGWTIRTNDGKPSAHYELAVAITKGEPDVLSTFEYIED